MMHQIWKRPILAIGPLLVAGYIVAALIVPALPLTIVASSILLVLSISVILVYWREAYDGLVRDGGPTRSDQLAMGICLSWACITMMRVSALEYRVFGPGGWFDGDLLTGAIFGSCLAAVLHLTAPHDIAVQPRRRSWMALGISIAVGAGIAGFLLGSTWRG